MRVYNTKRYTQYNSHCVGCRREFKQHSQIQCCFVVLYCQQWSCRHPHIAWSQVQPGPNSYRGWLCCLCPCFPLAKEARRRWQLHNNARVDTDTSQWQKAKRRYRWTAWGRAALFVCRTSFHCEAVSARIPPLSAWGRRSCGACPSPRWPLLSPHCHPPVATCPGNEAPFLETPVGSRDSSHKLLLK